jgi:hypothetical protein
MDPRCTYELHMRSALAHWLSLSILLVAAAAAARADGLARPVPPESGGGPAGAEAGEAPHPGRIGAPRPATDPYDRATLGDPAPRVYGQQPTLGDPRPQRRTSPRYCAGLLCD